MDGCIDKVDKHHSASSSIDVSVTRMHLLQAENPLSNNDKGKQQPVNHTIALSIIGEGTKDKYVNNRFYIIDLIGEDLIGEDRNGESHIKNGVQ